MARWLALAMVLMLAFPLVGCNGDQGNRPEDSMEPMLREAKKLSPGDEIKRRDAGPKKADKDATPQGTPDQAAGGGGK